MKKAWWTKKHKKIAVGLGLGIAASAALTFLLWRSMPAAPEAGPLNDAQSMASIQYTNDAKGVMLKPALKVTRGLVVYPENNVSPAAYAYKMAGVAQSGVVVIIVKTPLNIPQLDTRTLVDFAKLAPEVTDWYVAGHGEGGKKACEQAEGTQYKGIILLGSYCTVMVHDSVKALDIQGGNDRIINKNDADYNATNLAYSSEKQAIPGLNHAGFGNYGKQDGDGQLDLPDADVRVRLANLISKFMGIQN